VRVSVIGCGYLGTTHAAAMAEIGHDVRGVEIDPAKVERLSAGDIPFHEPGLAALISRHVTEGALTFTSDYADVADWADVHFVCVATPQRAGELAADLEQLENVIDYLAPLLTAGTLVVGKSTVPVGTAATVARRLCDAAPAGDEVKLVWNPEFLREGHAVNDTLAPDRIVIGHADGDEASARALLALYGPIASGSPVILTDFATSELVKVAANSFLATKISFINAMSDVCEAVGADVATLADALGHDARIGRRFLNAGLGYGGGCLPKDVRAFAARAGELGVGQSLVFLREIDAINEQRRAKAVVMTVELLQQPLVGSRVAVLGAAFKPESDDIRDSPALNVAGRLQLMGAHVTVYDPAANDNARRLWPTLNYASGVAGACDRADATLLLTEWQEFIDLRPEDLEPFVRAHKLLDTRNCLDPQSWRSAGWEFRAMGRRTPGG
jgi:UDPglucose 6-dehydrogenase